MPVLALPDAFDPAALDAVAARLGELPLRRLRETTGDDDPGADDPGPNGPLLLGKDARSAAVLVSLCNQRGEAAVLFTKRSEKVGTHKGQVSFPGGMADEGDRDAEHTALRELEEEVGIAQDAVRVLGRFHEAKAVTGVRVIPVLGFLGELEELELTINEDEIDVVFALTMAQLVDPDLRYEQMFSHRGPFPVFDAGPFPVWGLTAWIMREVLADVFGVKV